MLTMQDTSSDKYSMDEVNVTSGAPLNTLCFYTFLNNTGICLKIYFILNLLCVSTFIYCDI